MCYQGLGGKKKRVLGEEFRPRGCCVVGGGVVVVMKIISWNVRGLGGVEKKREVSNLVREKSPIILCLQETKLSVCNYIVCNSLWNDSFVDFSYYPSMGASGGLLTLWDSKEVEVWATFCFEHVLGIQGRFIRSGEEFTIFNVYAPCDSNRQQVLWQNLSARLDSLHDKNVCVCGDFNVVRHVDERRSMGSVMSPTGSVHYNQFIVDSCLVDLPLRGRRYTWYL
jgi:exonuclease III